MDRIERAWSDGVRAGATLHARGGGTREEFITGIEREYGPVFAEALAVLPRTPAARTFLEDTVARLRGLRAIGAFPDLDPAPLERALAGVA
ncbi:MAG: hypothetical protein HY721_16320 [Planctomycetes bacterium]|nr:hypothetical protein [Planctomycetota bacterium]